MIVSALFLYFLHRVSHISLLVSRALDFDGKGFRDCGEYLSFDHGFSLIVNIPFLFYLFQLVCFILEKYMSVRVFRDSWGKVSHPFYMSLNTFIGHETGESLLFPSNPVQSVGGKPWDQKRVSFDRGTCRILWAHNLLIYYGAKVEYAE